MDFNFTSEDNRVLLERALRAEAEMSIQERLRIYDESISHSVQRKPITSSTGITPNKVISGGSYKIQTADQFNGYASKATKATDIDSHQVTLYESRGAAAKSLGIDRNKVYSHVNSGTAIKSEATGRSYIFADS